MTIHGQQVATSSPHSTRVRTFELLSQDISQNDFGLPEHFYRIDTIPANYGSLTDAQKLSLLSSSQIEISYREGYPTFLDGQPIWKKMEHEPDVAYDLFSLYLEQPNSSSTPGYRQLSELQLEQLGKKFAKNLSLADVQELFIFYFWGPRAKAHDLFQVAVHRKMREKRMMHIEDYHYEEADRFLEALSAYESEIFTPDKMAALEPMGYIKLRKELFNIKRLALGISSGGNNGQSNRSADGQSNAPPPNASMEVVLRTIAKSSGAAETQSSEASLRAERDRALHLLTSDPESAGLVQELALRMAVGQKVVKKQQFLDSEALSARTRDLPLAPSAEVRPPSSASLRNPTEIEGTAIETTDTQTAPTDEYQDTEEDAAPIDDTDRELLG